MDDVRVVMDAAGSEQAALFGLSEGGPVAIMFAAAAPDWVRALVTFEGFTKTDPAPLPGARGAGGRRGTGFVYRE